jgi:hypothetical protein
MNRIVPMFEFKMALLAKSCVCPVSQSFDSSDPDVFDSDPDVFDSDPDPDPNSLDCTSLVLVDKCALTPHLHPHPSPSPLTHFNYLI